MKLLTITPNPAVDRTLQVPQLQPGQVQRAISVHLAAGGKGLNVQRAAQVLGVAGIATGPLAGNTGRQIRQLAEEEGLAADWFWLKEGESRNCLLIHQPGMDTTVINEAGPRVSAGEWKAFVEHSLRLAGTAECVAISGSFPPGTPEGGVAALVAGVASCAQRLVVDSSGAALREVIGIPVLIKVNQQELASGLQLEPPDCDFKSILSGARKRLRETGRGPESGIIVTRGRQAAYWIGPRHCWRAEVPAGKPFVSSVGSGDTFLAAVCCALLSGKPEPECLCWGVAAGSANVESSLPAHFEGSRFRQLLGQVGATEVLE